MRSSLGSRAPVSPSKPLHVTLYDAAARGGVCHYTFNLAESLVGAGCRVTLLTSHDYELADRPRAFDLVYIFKPSWIRSAFAVFRGGGASRPVSRSESRSRSARPGGPTLGRLQLLRLRLLLLRTAVRVFLSGSRVLHMQWGSDREEDARFLRMLKYLGIRTVYTAHDLMPHEGAGPGDADALGRIYRSVDCVVDFGGATGAELVSTFSVPAERVAVIPHGADSVLFRVPSQEFARRELGIAADRRVVLFFGHIKKYKGLEYLVEAFDRTRRTLPDAVLLVAGSLSSEDREEYERYSDLLAGLRQRQDVVCISEYIPVERVGLYFAAADLVALPYVRTYHSGILLAAYAAGRPVVVTDTGTLTEDVQEGRTGFVVPPQDAEALADRITAVIGRSDRGRSMGEAARQAAMTIHSWSVVAKRTMQLYRALVGGAPPVEQESGHDLGLPAGQVRTASEKGGGH
jgi:glycosyltransferase involved in cell wall biosynthesis